MRPNLKQARLKKGLTQKQIAAAINISTSMYIAIEGGKRTGNVRIWDELQDLLGPYQRTLRVDDCTTETKHTKEAVA